jgi:hypothetical protein
MNYQTTSQSNGIRLDHKEIRDVQGFEQVSLRVQNIQNDLVIQQGERESLVIEANPDLLTRVKTVVIDGKLNIWIDGSWSDLIKEALSTSLTRQRIQYTLMVRRLSALDVAGFAYIQVASLETDRLALGFAGPGTARFTRLHARLLEVDLAGPGKIELAGEVEEQRLSIRAIGFYYAPQLASKKAFVRLSGPGQAQIWVKDSLDATISGPGRLEYYGAPRIRQKTMPFGGLVSLGNP